jgi:hypothetical protein
VATIPLAKVEKMDARPTRLRGKDALQLKKKCFKTSKKKLFTTHVQHVPACTTTVPSAAAEAASISGPFLILRFTTGRNIHPCE